MPFVHIVTLKDEEAREAKATLRYGGLPELVDMLSEYETFEENPSDESIAGSFDTVYPRGEFRVIFHEDLTVSLERRLD